MINEGIYLEEKKGTVGVASTSRNVVFRNIWATREVHQGHAMMQLLDNDGTPTGIVEKFTVKEIGERLVHQPIKPETWAALGAKMEARLPNISSQPAAAPAAPAAPQAKPQSKPAAKTTGGQGGWWDVNRVR